MFLDRLNPHKANWDMHKEWLDSDNPELISQAEKIENAIEYLAPETKVAVQSIESRIKTTQNRYGDYMAYLNTVVPDSNTIMLYISAHALARNGGNKKGIVSALNILMR